MQFHHWQTLFDEAVKFNKGLRKASLEELFLYEHDSIVNSPLENFVIQNRKRRLQAEFDWIKAGKPYYKIHPKMASLLSKTNLDNIPSKFIEVPQQTICYRFADDVPTLYVKSGESYISKNTLSNLHVRSMLVKKIVKEDIEKLKETTTRKYPDFLWSSTLYQIILDEGARTVVDGVECTLCNNIALFANDDETIPESLERNLQERNLLHGKERYALNAMKDRLMTLFKIIISAGFLANTPEENLIVPDILNKDKEKYDQAVANNDHETVEKLFEKAKRRGHNGWNMGTNEMFIGEQQPSSNKQSTTTGKELRYSHFRAGHPHAVRYGPNKSKVKIKWFRPVRVRPDLPFSEEKK